MLEELTRNIPHFITGALGLLLLLATSRVVPRDRSVHLWIFAAICVLVARLPPLIPASVPLPFPGQVAATLHLLGMLAVLAGVEKHTGRESFGLPVRIAAGVSFTVYFASFALPSFTVQLIVTTPVLVILQIMIAVRLGPGSGAVERRVVPLIRGVWILVALSSGGRSLVAVLMRTELWAGPEASVAMAVFRAANPTLLSAALLGLSLIAFSRLADAYAVAQSKAEEATRAKSRLLANMSHDLRTPLNAIMGFAEIVRNAIVGPLPSRYRAYGDDIHRSAAYLLAIINRVLTSSEIESGRRRLIEAPHPLSELVADSLRLVVNQARSRDVCLQVTPYEDGFLSCDRVAIVEILSNLLTNAIAVSPRGATVDVSIDRTAKGVTIAIADRGPGLPAEVLANLGKPFNRPGDAFVAGNGRGGLGLSISVGLADLHGGAIDPVDRAGGGAVVSLTLPGWRWIAAAA